MKATIIVLLGLMVSCQQSPTKTLEVVPPAPAPIVKESNDTVQIEGAVRNFLHWYKTNYKEVNKVTFVDKNKRGDYKVNLDECKKFLNQLSSSGFISNVYVTEWNKYFESKAKYFSANPINEGPPEGFDYDLVLLTQEPEIVLEVIDTLKMNISDIKDGKAMAKVYSANVGYEFEMGKEDGKWKIDYIATMNYD